MDKHPLRGAGSSKTSAELLHGVKALYRPCSTEGKCTASRGDFPMFHGGPLNEKYCNAESLSSDICMVLSIPWSR